MEKRYGKRMSFGVKLLIFALVLLLIGAAVCFLLYRYSAVYEISRPEITMDSLMNEKSKQDWIDSARLSLNLDVSEFEDQYDIFDGYFANISEDASIAYRKEITQSTDDCAVFVVTYGGANLCRVTLAADESAKLSFGRHLWKVDSIKAADILKSLVHASVSIEAPADAKLFINGKPLSGKYITDDCIAFPDMTEIESHFVNVPHGVRYFVDALYGEIKVTDSFGREILPSADSTETDVRFEIIPEKENSVYISAPEDVQVILNGYELKAENALKSDLGLLKNVTDYTDGAEYKTVAYSFDDLYSVPEVKAFDASGKELTPVCREGGRYAFFHSNDEALEAEVIDAAKGFFNAYIEYCANAYEITRYTRAINKVLRHSTLYKYIAESNEGMIFASKTSTSYNELEFGNFSRVGDRCFVCTVSYSADLTAKTWYEEYSYELENAYEISFVYDNYVWLATDMTVVP